MKKLDEFLSERELFVLRNHPQMTYAKIAERYGVTPERIRQIKTQAERKVRTEIRCQNASKRAEEEVFLTLKRREIWLIKRALDELDYKYISQRADMRRKKTEPHPDEAAIKKLITEFNSF